MYKTKRTSILALTKLYCPNSPITLCILLTTIYATMYTTILFSAMYSSPFRNDRPIIQSYTRHIYVIYIHLLRGIHTYRGCTHIPLSLSLSLTHTHTHTHSLSLHTQPNQPFTTPYLPTTYNPLYSLYPSLRLHVIE